MKSDEIMITVPIKKKEYHYSDVIQSLMTDKQFAYKNGENFILMKVDNHAKMKKIIKQIVELQAEETPEPSHS